MPTVCDEGVFELRSETQRTVDDVVMAMHHLGTSVADKCEQLQAGVARCTDD
ncbi:MAG: hypothetical protein U0892_10095 [Pirellulales bacterium]